MPPASSVLRGALPLVMAGLAALAYDAAVDPAFTPVRVPLIASPITAGDGRVRVEMPRLDALRDQVTVIAARVEAGPASAGRVRLYLGRVERGAADLPAGGSARMAFVPGAGTMRALQDAAAGPHVIEFAGEGRGWRITRLDAANVYWDAAGSVAIVPKAAPHSTRHRGVVWAVLAALALIAALSGSALPSRRLRRTHRIAASVAAVVLVAAVAVPGVTRVRMLLGPEVFWALTGVIFAAALWKAASWLGRGIGAGAALGAPVIARHRLTCQRGGTLLGLVALAVCQPLYDVVAQSPEFFVARNTTWSLALLAAAALGFGVPLLLLLIERGIRRVSPRAAALYFYLVVALLLAVMVHPWLKRNDLADPWVMASAAMVAGIAGAMLAWRRSGVRELLGAMGAAAFIVPVLFFARGDVYKSLTPSTSRLAAAAPLATPPVVLVVFDEFPLHSLLDETGQIDRVRFPNFAALSQEASWYREATTVSSQTLWAVPAIASGRYPETPDAVPTLRYYPQNLFTLLAGRYEMFVFGRFLQLCPPESCQTDVAGPGDTPAALVADLVVVWLHIVLPAPLTEHLPPIVGDWLGFARAGKWRWARGMRVRNDRPGEFARFVSTIAAGPARLYFLHSLLPHMPYAYMPSGREYAAPDYQGRQENRAGLFLRVSPAYADAVHQRHLLQVGYVDTLVGTLVTRLRTLGIYDQSLIIVTADHGTSFLDGQPRRIERDRNLADVIRVPLFVKRPGQRTGGAVDGVVESVDILPTIASVLGLRPPLAVDGVPLGEAPPSRATRTFIDRGLARARRRDVSNWKPSSQASLERRLARFASGSFDGVFRLPGTESLVGTDLGTLRTRPGTTRLSIVGSAAFSDVDLDSGVLPLHVRGRVFTRLTRPLAVAVNGRIVATTETFLERGATVFSTMIPESSLRRGRNALQVLVIDRTGTTTTLETTVSTP